MKSIEHKKHCTSLDGQRRCGASKALFFVLLALGSQGVLVAQDPDLSAALARQRTLVESYRAQAEATPANSLSWQALLSAESFECVLEHRVRNTEDSATIEADCKARIAATVERWKQAQPSSASPYLLESSQLGPAERLRTLERLVERFPSDFEAASRYLSMLEEQGQDDRLRAFLDAQIARNSHDARFLAMVHAKLLQRHEDPKASQVLDAWLQAAPHDAGALRAEWQRSKAWQRDESEQLRIWSRMVEQVDLDTNGLGLCDPHRKSAAWAALAKACFQRFFTAAQPGTPLFDSTASAYAEHLAAIGGNWESAAALVEPLGDEREELILTRVAGRLAEAKRCDESAELAKNLASKQGFLATARYTSCFETDAFVSLLSEAADQEPELITLLAKSGETRLPFETLSKRLDLRLAQGEDSETLEAKASLARLQGDSEGELAALLRWVKLNPAKNTDLVADLGRLLIARGAVAQAREVLTEASKNPSVAGSSKVAEVLARAALLAGDDQGVERTAEKLAELGPAWQANLLRARLALEAEDFDQAGQEFNAFFASAPRAEWFRATDYGGYLAHLGDGARARSFFEESFDAAQERGNSLGKRETFVGEGLAQNGFFTEALAVFEKALESASKDAEIYQRIADLAEMVGDASRAEEALQKLRELDPRNVTNPLRLAELYAKQGRRAEAFDLLTEAQQDEDLSKSLGPWLAEASLLTSQEGANPPNPAQVVAAIRVLREGYGHVYDKARLADRIQAHYRLLGCLKTAEDPKLCSPF